MLKQSYWNKQGTFQNAVDQLNLLIPAEGSVDKPRSTNRCLEKFRKASNCYHDLYNNGLINRASEFRKVFGIRSSAYHTGRGLDWGLYVAAERVMDDIVLAAAQEQGIAVDVADSRYQKSYA